MIKQSFVFLMLSVLLHLICIFYLICNTLFFYDYPFLLPVSPFLHITICLIIFKNKKTIICISILAALSIIIILFVLQTNMQKINVINFGEDYANSKCMTIKDLKNDSIGSAGAIRYYNRIMTNEYFDYIEKEFSSNNEDVCMLEYYYNNFFFEGNADCFYERIYSNYIIEENDYIAYGKSKAFVINLNSEISYIKEFCIKNETEVIHGMFWGDIDKEDLLKKIDELYF